MSGMGGSGGPERLELKVALSRRSQPKPLSRSAAMRGAIGAAGLSSAVRSAIIGAAGGEGRDDVAAATAADWRSTRASNVATQGDGGGLDVLSAAAAFAAATGGDADSGGETETDADAEGLALSAMQCVGSGSGVACGRPAGSLLAGHSFALMSEDVPSSSESESESSAVR